MGGGNNTNLNVAQRGRSGRGRTQNIGQGNDESAYDLPGPAQTNVNKTKSKPLSPQSLFESVAPTGEIAEQSKATVQTDNLGL